MILLLGLVLGGLSGGITYALTAEASLALLVGIVATVLTWLGAATLLFLDD
ncbi:hypothetical protein ACWGN5_07610 [Streptomyces sp. NPDC055815]